MNWLSLLTLITCLFAGNVKSLSLDPVASSELEQYIKKGDVVISMRHIRPRRKLHISIEALFMIDFPTIKNKMSFFLDRKQQRITLDISENGSTESHNFDILSINETTSIRSLAFHFHKNRITLLVDCKSSISHDIIINMSKLYNQMEDPVIKLFRERKYPLNFDGNVKNSLQRTNCEKVVNRRGNTKMLKNKISEREKNKKRDVRNWFSNDPSNNMQYRQESVPIDIERRGDIPVMHGDCEDAIAKSINDLLALVKLLREDVAQQRQEISYIRGLLENCVGCKEPNDNNQLHIESTCRTSNPCYPGVECHDSLSGLRCGHCPNGMVGDGKICKPGITCKERPCFVGVQCHDTINGAQCDPCPNGYEGDGRICTIRNACLDNPCPAGNIIVPTHNVQHYQRQYTARKYSVMTS